MMEIGKKIKCMVQENFLMQVVKLPILVFGKKIDFKEKEYFLMKILQF